MEALNSLESHVEKRCLQISVRLASKSKVCPRCKHGFTLLTDIDNQIDRIRYVVYCHACKWFMCLIERIPSVYRTMETTEASEDEWPPPLDEPPIAS